MKSFVLSGALPLVLSGASASCYQAQRLRAIAAPDSTRPMRLIARGEVRLIARSSSLEPHRVIHRTTVVDGRAGVPRSAVDRRTAFHRAGGRARWRAGI